MKNLVKFTVLCISLICFTGCNEDTDLSDFPYPIMESETKTIYIASEKWISPHNDDGHGNQLYESPYYWIKEDIDSEWEVVSYSFMNFNYRNGYEYKIKGILITYLKEGDMLMQTFKCTRVISKKKKQSQNLPQ